MRRIRIDATVAFAVAGALLLSASLVYAWTGPVSLSTSVPAPVTLLSEEQIKDGALGVDSLAVYGSQYIQGTLGIGVASTTFAVDVAGTLRLGNGGETCAAGMAGALRYESASARIQYCDGDSWTAI